MSRPERLTADSSAALRNDKQCASTDEQCLVSRYSPDQARQAELRMTLQKLPRWKLGSLSASTSALTVPKVESGLCLKPLLKAWMMSSLNWGVRGKAWTTALRSASVKLA